MGEIDEALASMPTSHGGQLLKERRQDVATIQLRTDHHLTSGVNAMKLKGFAMSGPIA
jgi:hypothetical protein